MGYRWKPLNRNIHRGIGSYYSQECGLVRIRYRVSLRSCRWHRCSRKPSRCLHQYHKSHYCIDRKFRLMFLSRGKSGSSLGICHKLHKNSHTPHTCHIHPRNIQWGKRMWFQKAIETGLNHMPYSCQKSLSKSSRWSCSWNKLLSLHHKFLCCMHSLKKRSFWC